MIYTAKLVVYAGLFIQGWNDAGQSKGCIGLHFSKPVGPGFAFDGDMHMEYTVKYGYIARKLV